MSDGPGCKAVKQGLTVTSWVVVHLLDTAHRPGDHVHMLSLLAEILLEIFHKIQRVRLFLAHRDGLVYLRGVWFYGVGEACRI